MANPNRNQLNSKLRSLPDWTSQTKGISKEINQTTSKNSLTQKPDESAVSKMPKLILFRGEVSQSKVQRVDVMIPTEDGQMITQRMILLPLKLRDRSTTPPAVAESANSGILESPAQPLPRTSEPPSPIIKSLLSSPQLPNNHIKYSYELGSGPMTQRFEGSVPFLYQKVSKYRSNVWVSNKMKILANSFQQRRKRLGLTQVQAATALKEILGPTFTRNLISRFEKLELAPIKFWQIQPFLQNWIIEVEKLTVNN